MVAKSNRKLDIVIQQRLGKLVDRGFEIGIPISAFVIITGKNNKIGLITNHRVRYQRKCPRVDIVVILNVRQLYDSELARLIELKCSVNAAMR
jgi:hypothetical protein